MHDLPGELERDNEEAFGALVEQLRALSGGVIPFVGAGMSKAFEFPTWEQFLREEAQGSEEVLEQVDAGDYLNAAQTLQARLGGDRFHRRINHVFGREPAVAEVSKGPLSLLASLVRGPVITTNFDRVLERVFAGVDNQFDDVIIGAQLDSIVRAIHTGSHALLKIHGDAEERTSRTFTLLEYRESYETGEIKVPDLALLMFGNRPLLFLGCSLAPDTTVDVLRDVHDRLQGVRHFAIVATEGSEEAMARRRDDLDACGISPIWFPAGHFDLIEERLWRLQEHVGSRELQPGFGRTAEPPSERLGRGPFDDLPRKADGIEPVDPAAVRRPASAALQGRLAFVVSPEYTRDELIRQVASELGVSATQYESERNARRILAWHRTQEIIDAVKNIVASPPAEPSLVSHFLAALPGFLRVTRQPDVAAQLIFSTDYGTVLEQTLDAAGEPFHLLYYMAAGDDHGRFLHRAPDGAVSIIDRPLQMAGFRREESVVVKLRGGALHRADEATQRPPESICIEAGDFARAAGRLLEALPRGIRLAMSERSLLLLGYGLLDEPEVNTLVRARGTEAPPESWAFEGADLGRDTEYWSMYGVQKRGERLYEAILGLHRELQAAA